MILSHNHTFILDSFKMIICTTKSIFNKYKTNRMLYSENYYVLLFCGAQYICNSILEDSFEHVGYTASYLGILYVVALSLALYIVALYRSNQTLPRAFHWVEQRKILAHSFFLKV